MDDRIPLTVNRAITAVRRSRAHVERAREEAHLAVDILTRLNGAAPAAADEVQRRLEGWLDRLAAVEEEAPRWDPVTEEVVPRRNR